MALTRDRIVDVALRLMEQGGLESVTFRKVAAELDVSAPTLCWHVQNKRRLLDLMAEELMARTHASQSLSPLPDETWDAWLERRTRSMYQTLVAHRDAPRVAAGNRPTVVALPAIEEAISTLVEAGFDPGDAVETILSVGTFAIGCALEWQAEASREASDAPDSELAAEIQSGRYPAMVKALTAHRERRRDEHHEMFEFGLALLLDGLRARLASTVPARL